MENTIEEDNFIKLNKYKLNKPNPSYLAGFIDGDGNIFIRKIKDGYQSGISITQSRTNILQIIQYHYGGTIHCGSTILTEDIMNEDGFYDKNNRRNSYTLTIYSNEYKFILEDIYEYIILKKVQIEALMEISKIVNKPNYGEEKEKLYEICSNSNLNKIPENYDFNRFNEQYICGLFDAEGCLSIEYKKIDNEIRFTKGIYMKITQKNHPEIIRKIYEYLKVGRIDTEYIYKIENFTDCFYLINILKNNLIVKENQLNAFEEYISEPLKLNNTKYNEKIHLKRLNIYKIMNKEKHQIEVYNISTEPNKEGYIQRMNCKIEEEEKQKNIKKEEFYKLKSVAMKGKNNVNYGKKFTENTVIQMKKSIAIKKRDMTKYSDEILYEIIDLKGKMSQTDISEKYGIHRNQILRIWNGEMLPINHPDFGKIIELNEKEKNINEKATPQQKTSIGKRSLEINEIVDIILWKVKSKNGEKIDNKKICSTNLSELLTKTFNKKVTNDMVKNIWNGRTKIFDFELQNNDYGLTYEKYLEIIEL